MLDLSKLLIKAIFFLPIPTQIDPFDNDLPLDLFKTLLQEISINNAIEVLVRI